MSITKEIANHTMSEFTPYRVKDLIEKRPWMEKCKFTMLSKTIEIEQYIDHCIEKGLCALDLETTGLNTRKTKDGRTFLDLVGVCLATSSTEGVYIPVGHEDNEFNVPLKFVIKQIARLCANCRCIFHNFKYDGEILRNFGILIEDEDMYEDTLLMAAVEDASRKKKDLKFLAESLLGREMIEIDSMGVEGSNKKMVAFNMVPPQKAVYYGASDSMCTFGLYEYFKQKLDEMDPTGKKGPWAVYRIEKRCLFVTMEMERNLVKIDRKYLLQVHKDVSDRIQKSEAAIYELAGRKFDIKSPQQLGLLLFDEMKIPYPAKEKTKTGQYITNEKVIELLAGKYPIVDMILAYRGYEKILSTYIENMLNNADENDEIKFNLNQVQADTGRFSSTGGQGLSIDGYSGINCQNIPNHDPDDPKSIDLRRAVIARPGYKMVSVDYSGEELRIAANLSKEPKWIHEFLYGSADLHTKTAQAVTGKAEVTKFERKNAKCVAKGTLIATERGWLPIENVNSGDRVITHNGSLKRVSAVHDMGVKEGRLIRTTSGHRITCGINHRFLTDENKWVRAEDLTPGQKIKIVSCEEISPNKPVQVNLSFWDKGDNNFVSKDFPVVEINSLWARLLGYLLGGRHINLNSASMVCSTKFEDVKDDVIDIAKKLELPCKYKLRFRTGAKNPLWQITFESTILCRFLNHISFSGHRGKIFRIPRFIFESPKEISKEFLKGLFETYGAIEKSYSSVYTKDIQLAEDVVLLLASFGIKACVYAKPSKKYKRDYYMVRMTRYASKLFEERIGFISKNKIDRLRVLNEKPIRPGIYSKPNWVTSVKSNDPVDSVSLMDLTVEEDHTYVAQGLVTHNTLNFHILYGGGAGGFAVRAKLPYEVSKKMLINFFREYDQLKRWVDREAAASRKRGYSITALGRRRPLLDFYNHPDPKVQAKGDRCAVNAAIQGSAADIIKIALYRLWKWIRENGLQDDIRILAPIHDEILFEIKEDKLDALIPEVCRIMCMSDVTKKLGWAVPLEVDAEYGDSFHVDHDFWKELKKKKEEAPVEDKVLDAKPSEPAPKPESINPPEPVAEQSLAETEVIENKALKSIAVTPAKTESLNTNSGADNLHQYYLNITVKSVMNAGISKKEDIKGILEGSEESKITQPAFNGAHIKDRIDSRGYFNYPMDIDMLSALKLKFIFDTLSVSGDSLFIGPKYKICIVSKDGEVYYKSSEAIAIDAFMALCIVLNI